MHNSMNALNATELYLKFVEMVKKAATAALLVRKPKVACGQDRGRSLCVEAWAFDRVSLAQVAKKAEQ